LVKAVARLSDGSCLLVLGISQGNVDRLRAGDPIYVDVTALKVPATATISKVTIFYGATEAELARTVRTLIGPETTVFTIPRGSKDPQ